MHLPSFKKIEDIFRGRLGSLSYLNHALIKGPPGSGKTYLVNSTVEYLKCIGTHDKIKEFNCALLQEEDCRREWLNIEKDENHLFVMDKVDELDPSLFKYAEDLLGRTCVIATARDKGKVKERDRFSIQVEIPPLCESRIDILHCFAQQCQGMSIQGGELLNLITYHWPGNYRELDRAVQEWIDTGSTPPEIKFDYEQIFDQLIENGLEPATLDLAVETCFPVFATLDGEIASYLSISHRNNDPSASIECEVEHSYTGPLDEREFTYAIKSFLQLLYGHACLTIPGQLSPEKAFNNESLEVIKWSLREVDRWEIGKPCDSLDSLRHALYPYLENDFFCISHFGKNLTQKQLDAVKAFLKACKRECENRQPHHRILEKWNDRLPGIEGSSPSESPQPDHNKKRTHTLTINEAVKVLGKTVYDLVEIARDHPGVTEILLWSAYQNFLIYQTDLKKYITTNSNKDKGHLMALNPEDLINSDSGACGEITVEKFLCSPRHMPLSGALYKYVSDLHLFGEGEARTQPRFFEIACIQTYNLSDRDDLGKLFISEYCIEQIKEFLCEKEELERVSAFSDKLKGIHLVACEKFLNPEAILQTIQNKKENVFVLFGQERIVKGELSIQGPSLTPDKMPIGTKLPYTTPLPQDTYSHLDNSSDLFQPLGPAYTPGELSYKIPIKLGTNHMTSLLKGEIVFIKYGVLPSGDAFKIISPEDGLRITIGSLLVKDDLLTIREPVDKDGKKPKTDSGAIIIDKLSEIDEKLGPVLSLADTGKRFKSGRPKGSNCPFTNLMLQVYEVHANGSEKMSAKVLWGKIPTGKDSGTGLIVQEKNEDELKIYWLHPRRGEKSDGMTFKQFKERYTTVKKLWEETKNIE